jgi:predicted nuclease of restriction endonuclease-like (RecB) superfamily
VNQALTSKAYAILLQDLKSEISKARIRAHLAVNKEMISLYWNIGSKILERQKEEGWGSKVIENVSKDLRSDFPEMKGLSARNLKYMRRFADEYRDLSIVQELLAQITWGHNCIIMDKVQNTEERLWYISKTIENGWSRNVLSLQIQSNLYAIEGINKPMGVSQFKLTEKLPEQLKQYLPTAEEIGKLKL